MNKLNTMWMMMSMDVQVLVMAYMYNVYNDIIDVQKQSNTIDIQVRVMVISIMRQPPTSQFIK